MKINKAFISFIASISSLVSCTSSTYEEISGNVKNPTYVANIEPIIKANCISCHSKNAQFPNLTTYTEVKDATQNGDVICRIDQTQACGSVMPQSGPMQKQNIDMIILWKSQGCKN